MLYRLLRRLRGVSSTPAPFASSSHPDALNPTLFGTPPDLAALPEERTVFQHLRQQGFLEGFAKKRILEIGPKHGGDSRLLASLDPAELVLIDLPSKQNLVQQWLPDIQALCPTRYIEANLLYMSAEQLAEIGTFDLVFCLGVLYHNAEQLRLIKRLYDLTALHGVVVIQSSTTRNPVLADLNVVEIHWPQPYGKAGTVTHHPSRRAIQSWMEMVGYQEVRLWQAYGHEIDPWRAVLTGKRTPTSKTHDTRFRFDDDPEYAIGDAT